MGFEYTKGDYKEDGDRPVGFHCWPMGPHHLAPGASPDFGVYREPRELDDTALHAQLGWCMRLGCS